jgi:hypothetical protein
MSAMARWCQRLFSQGSKEAITIIFCNFINHSITTS